MVTPGGPPDLDRGGRFAASPSRDHVVHLKIVNSSRTGLESIPLALDREAYYNVTHRPIIARWVGVFGGTAKYGGRTFFGDPRYPESDKFVQVNSGLEEMGIEPRSIGANWGARPH